MAFFDYIILPAIYTNAYTSIMGKPLTQKKNSYTAVEWQLLNTNYNSITKIKISLINNFPIKMTSMKISKIHRWNFDQSIGRFTGKLNELIVLLNWK